MNIQIDLDKRRHRWTQAIFSLFLPFHLDLCAPACLYFDNVDTTLRNQKIENEDLLYYCGLLYNSNVDVCHCCAAKMAQRCACACEGITSYLMIPLNTSFSFIGTCPFLNTFVFTDKRLVNDYGSINLLAAESSSSSKHPHRRWCSQKQ